jgi:pilus assembly protein Flp/PilA
VSTKNTKHLAIMKLLMSEESGQDLIEYALIAALIAVAAVAAMQGLATAINGELSNVSGQLT